MGVFIIVLAHSASMTGGTSFQVSAGDLLARAFMRIQQWLSPVPEPVLGLALLAVAFVFVWATLVGRRRPSPPPPDASPSDDTISTSQGSVR